jgi:hypothetical protein
VEIEDQQYKDQLSVRLIQAVLIPSYLALLAEKQATILYYVYYVMWWGVCTKWQSWI